MEEDLAFRVLAADNFPRHRTLCDFRKQHLGAFREVFVQVIQIAWEAELIRLGALVIDGTKIKANASKHKAMSYGRLQEEEARLSKEVDELCGQARAVDEAEDEQFGPAQRGDELPEELQHRQSRLSKIRAAKAKLEAEQAQVDGEFQIIVANHQDNNASDNGRLVPLLDGIEATWEASRSSVWPIRATVRKRIFRPWKRRVLTVMSRYAEKVRGCETRRDPVSGHDTNGPEVCYPRGAGDLLSAQASGRDCERLDQ